MGSDAPRMRYVGRARPETSYLGRDSIAFHSVTSFALPASGVLRFHAAYMSTISFSIRCLLGELESEALSTPCHALSRRGSAS